MKTLFFPVFLLLCALMAGFNYLQRMHTARSKNRTVVANIAKSAKDAEKANRETEARINSAYDQIARGRDFLTAWQAAQARSVRGGVENTVQELASAQEITVPTPLMSAAKPYLSSERGPITAKQMAIRGDGNITGLIKFMAECERAFPLGIVQAISLKPTDRDPKLEMEFMVLDRNFAEMPELPADAPAAENTGQFALRPDMQRLSVPNLPDNLVTRGAGRAAPLVISGVGDMSKIAPDLKITGVIWSNNPADRILLANGKLLRPGMPLPTSLVREKGRVILTEIGRGFARFTIETEVFNSVTNKTETEYVKRELAFTVFNELTSEG